MKSVRSLLAIGVVVALGAWGVLAWMGAAKPKLEEHTEGIITSPKTLGIRNFTVLRVETNGRKVHVDWKGFNVRTGNAFNVPYEEIVLTSGSETYHVSDEDAGNNELRVNGKLYSFDSDSEQLLIRFGSGVSIEPGGDYQSATKQYEADFSRSKEDGD